MATADGEQVYLDPGSSQSVKTTYTGPLGMFQDALSTSAFVNGLEQDNSVFVRGLGLAHLDATMLSGSSGGFLDSMELVEVRLPGVALKLPAPR